MIFRMNHQSRMRIEGDKHAHTIDFFPNGLNPVDQLLMALVHAVKSANGDYGILEGRKRIDIPVNEH
jgi:hypothetical protein